MVLQPIAGVQIVGSNVMKKLRAQKKKGVNREEFLASVSFAPIPQRQIASLG